MQKPHEHDGWTDDDQTEFWSFVKKARTRKLDYISRKANRLSRSGVDEKIDAAIEMAAECVDAYTSNDGGIRDNQKYPAAYKSDVVYLSQFLATTCLARGRHEEADRWAQTMFEIYNDSYSRCGVPDYETYTFAETCIETRDQREAEHILALVESTQEEPRGWTDLRCAARLWQTLGHDELSMKRWLSAYAHDEEWVPFDVLRDRVIVDVHDSPYLDPEDAAEGIVVNHHGVTDAVFTPDRAALEALDSILGVDGPRSHRADGYQRYYQQETLVPELGAFIGRVVVATLGASWVAREPLMHSVVVLDGAEIDPFEIAFARVFFERSMTSWFDALRTA